MNLELSNALLTFKRWLICILFNEYLCAVYCLPGTFFFFFFGGDGTGFELRASHLARQVLYHLSHSASLKETFFMCIELGIDLRASHLQGKHSVSFKQ
jgi:hypothetical protein